MKKVLWLLPVIPMLVFGLTAAILVNADAIFKVSNLTINPKTVKEGETVNITVLVSNVGDTKDTYTVELQINDEVKSTKDVTVNTGDSKEAKFAVSLGTSGEYSVQIDDLTSSFSVMPYDLKLDRPIIDPTEITEGGSVTISTLANNEGEEVFSYTLILRINSEVAGNYDITNLEPGSSEEINFTVIGDEVGDHIIELGKQTGLFVVKKSFWAMFPPYLWAIFGAILSILILFVIVLVIMPPGKKRTGAAPKAKKSRKQAPPPDPMPLPTPTLIPTPPTEAPAGAPMPMPTSFPTAAVPPSPIPAPIAPAAPVPPPPPTVTPHVPSATRPIFTVSNLNITPNQVKQGESINISAIVTNGSTTEGKYSLVLRINGVVENITELSLTPGASQVATFTVVKDSPGDYYAEVDGLGGAFSVIPLIPAHFTISNLVIAPERAKQGAAITISAIVTNTGEVNGTYSVVLRIKGIAEGIEEITLSANESKRVDFNITKDTPGFYQVDLEGITGRFVVEMDWTA